MKGWHKTQEDLEKELLLIEKAKENPAAFAPLYQANYKSIFLFVYRRVANDDISADITSQVFLKALLNLPKYTFRGNPFSAWLFRIALNEINQHFRKTDQERAVFMDDSGFERLKSEFSEDNSENDQIEKEEELIQILNHLTESEVHYLELRFFENKPFKEIGEILNITENNAKVKTYRIIDKLKSLLKKS